MSRTSKRRIPPWTPCGYCFQEWANTWDHIKPISDNGRHSKSNLYPSCRRCNSILQNRQFETMAERREYVKQRLIERGEWQSADNGEELRPLDDSGIPRV